MNRRLFGLLPNRSAASVVEAGAGFEQRKREYLLTIDIFRDLQPGEIAELDRHEGLVELGRGRITLRAPDRPRAYLED